MKHFFAVIAVIWFLSGTAWAEQVNLLPSGQKFYSKDWSQTQGNIGFEKKQDGAMTQKHARTDGFSLYYTEDIPLGEGDYMVSADVLTNGKAFASGGAAVQLQVFPKEGTARLVKANSVATDGKWQNYKLKFSIKKSDRAVRIWLTLQNFEGNCTFKNVMIRKIEKLTPDIKLLEYFSAQFEGMIDIVPDKVFFVQVSDPKAEIRLNVWDIDRRKLLEKSLSDGERFMIPGTSARATLSVKSASGKDEILKVVHDQTDFRNFDWREHNSWEMDSAAEPCVISREFELPEKPEFAMGRFYGNNELVIRINGTEIGKMSSAYTDAYYYNIVKYLKPGKNLIELISPDQTLPKGTYSSNVDIQMIFPDGREFIILSSDGQWQYARKNDLTQKMPLTYQLSWYRNDQYHKNWVWPSAVPPKLFDRKAAKAKFEDGKIEINFTENFFNDRNRLKIEFLNDRNEVVWHQFVFPKNCDLRKMLKGTRAEIPFMVDYEFLPEKSALKIRIDEKLKVGNDNIIGEIFTGSFDRTRPQVSLVEKNFTPYVRIGDEIFPWAIFYSRPYFDATQYGRYCEDDYKEFADSGYRFMTACANFGRDVHKSSGVNIGDIWIGEDQYNFEPLDAVIREVLSAAPDSYIILMLGLDTPSWWKDKHPDELAGWDNGGVASTPSYASQKWGDDTALAIRRVLEYTKQRPYGNRILAAYFIGGYDGQWFQSLDWSEFPYALTDYSKPMQKYFPEYLRKIYHHDVDQLRAAWGNDRVTFENVTIPTREERLAGSYYLDPVAQRNVIDFTAALGMAVNDRMEQFGSAVKTVDGQLFSGGYYIPLDVTYVFGQAQRPDSDKIYDSKNFDFAASPMAYTFREIFNAGELATGKNQKYRVNNKFELVEDDNRTFRNLPIVYTWGNHTMFESNMAMRRHIAQRLSIGKGHWYFDMYGHWYSNEALQKIFSDELKLKKLQAKYESLPAVEAEVVMLDKNGTLNHKRLTTQKDLQQVHYWRRFDATSYPVDNAIIRDLDNPKLPKYKIYIFGDLFALNPDELARIDQLKRDGNILVFQHAAGYSNERVLAAANMSELTGINLVEADPGVDLSNMSWNYASGTHPVLSGLSGQAMTGFEAKRFAVEDAAAVPLGVYASDGKIAAAVKDNGSWTSIYLPTTYPPGALMANIGKFGKVHVYTVDPVILRAGSRFVSAYCNRKSVAGSIKLPDNLSAYDVFGDKLHIEPSEIPFELVMGDTLLLFVGTPDEVKDFQMQYRGMPAKSEGK